MITVRSGEERGHEDHGWLDTRHTFSFAEYFDPEHMGYRSLRVINEDRVAPKRGFPPHAHRDMEIISYVIEGELAHEDSMGNGSVVRAGEVQRMSAGTGVLHGEWNASDTEPVHFLQIWIVPARRDLPPSYEQQPVSDRRNELVLLASPDGRERSLTVHQDAQLFLARLDAGKEVAYHLPLGRHAWVHVARGKVTLDGATLRAGDGAAAEHVSLIALRAEEPSEVLLFDLA